MSGIVNWEALISITASKHDWKRGETLQWGELGADYSTAQTPFVCARCDAKFIHFYHDEPNIWQAMRDAGIDPDNCKDAA